MVDQCASNLLFMKTIIVARRLFGIPVDLHPTGPPEMCLSRPQCECRINGLHFAVSTILTEVHFYFIFRWRRNEEKMVFHWKTGELFSIYLLWKQHTTETSLWVLSHICNVLHIHDSQQPQMRRRKKTINHLTWLVQTLVRESHTYIQQF